MVYEQDIQLWFYDLNEHGCPISSTPYAHVKIEFAKGIKHQEMQKLLIERLKENIEEYKKAGIE